MIALMAMRTFLEVIKDTPSVGDVHVASTLGNNRSRRRRLPVSRVEPTVPPVQKAQLQINVPITKVSDELRTVYGWASVNSEGGHLVTDVQDDQIDDAELIKAAHDFVTSSRAGGLMHARGASGAHRLGDVVESLVLTPDIQKALGVDLGKTGWFIGYRVNDDDAWDLVKDGTLKAFSIGGRARRVPN